MWRCGSVFVVLCLAGSTAFCSEFGRGYRERDSISLNGTWQAAREHENDEVWKPDVAAGEKWADVNVPGLLVDATDPSAREGTRFVWARRTFVIDAAHAAKGAVLRWGGITFGATAWLNGTKIDEHAGIGPNTVMLPAGLTKAGENVLLLKVPGYAGLVKSKSGLPLFPVGAGTQRWGSKAPAVFYDIWMDFYDAVYVRRVLAIPNLKDRKVTFRIWLDGVAERPDGLVVVGRAWAPNVVNEAAVAKTAAPKGKDPVELDLSPAVFKTWSIEEPNVYVGSVRVHAADGKLLDGVEFSFGLRELKVEGGHYALNGNPFWFRGSDLVNEWLWGMKFNENINRYIVDEARQMNLNSFRTHTCPPPHTWLDVADKEGVFILAEMPLLYNGRKFNFTPEELDVFHKNAQADVEAWVSELWNHPSVALWVLSNETTENAWEMGPLQDAVNALDPTRTTMRTDSRRGTRDNADVHTCGNVWDDSECMVIPQVTRYAAEKDPRRTLTNTEYMNAFGDGSLKWQGASKDPKYPLTYAELCMEHTEAMRRLNYDGLFPYMYAGFTGFRTGRQWRQDYPTEMSASLHSCMAPVLASLDIVDRDYVPGRKMLTRAALINEMLKEVPAKLDLYVTPKDPLLVPDEDALKAAVSHETFNVIMKPASIGELGLAWTVPEKEGNYWLALVTTREGDKPVVSERIIRSVAGPSVGAKKRVVLLGARKEMEQWFRDRGVETWTVLPEGGIVADAMIVCDTEASGITEKAGPETILEYAKSGGRVVVLDPANWSWYKVAGFKTSRVASSRAFAYPDAKHWLLDGIDPEWLKRWNGLPSIIADRALKDLPEGAKKVLWIEAPANPVLASIPTGKGEIVLTTLKIAQRVSKDSKDYDPVAERMLANVLSR